MRKGLKNKYIGLNVFQRRNLLKVLVVLIHTTFTIPTRFSISVDQFLVSCKCWKFLKYVQHCYWLPALKLGNAVCLRSAKLLNIFSHLNCKNFILESHFYCLSEKKNHHEDIIQNGSVTTTLWLIFISCGDPTQFFFFPFVMGIFDWPMILKINLALDRLKLGTF
jgi:hypothetical protein